MLIPICGTKTAGHHSNMLLDDNPRLSDPSGYRPSRNVGPLPHTCSQRLLLDTRPLNCETTQTSSLTPEISSPALNTQEEMEPGVVSELEGIIPHIRRQITEVTPPSPPDGPLDQLGTQPSLSALVPIPTSYTTPDPIILSPPGPVSQLDGTISHISHQIPEVIPHPPSDVPPFNQTGAQLPPVLASTSIFDANSVSAILKPSGPLRPFRAIRRYLRRFRRKPFHSS